MYSNQTQLTTLYLHNNKIGSSGAQSLSDGLKSNSTLTTLNLNSNKIGSSGAQSLGMRDLRCMETKGAKEYSTIAG